MNSEAIRKQIDAHTPQRASISTSQDLPLSEESQRVLEYAADEADNANGQGIGTEHLLLGLLLVEEFFGGQLLRQVPAEPAKLRAQIEAGPIFFLGPRNTLGCANEP